MTTWLPTNLTRGFDDLFRDLERSVWISAPTRGKTNGDAGRTFGALDVKEEPDRYIVHFDAPGVKKQDVEVTLDGQMLRVAVSEKQEEVQEEKEYLYRERFQREFSRSVPLPKAASEEIVANLKEGVLTIEIKKAPEKTTRKIAVN